jgi:pimeloyl-ACP methyl ester carboxylesterase
MVRLVERAPALYRLQGWLCRWPAYARFTFRPWFYDMNNPAWPDWEIDRRMAQQPELHLSAVRAGQAIHAADLTPWLPKISAPTLAIFGRQDGVVPISDGELVQRLVPAGRLALIERCATSPCTSKPLNTCAFCRSSWIKP